MEFPYFEESVDINPTFARFFVIKSYSAEHVLNSIKHGVWTSTDAGNKRLDDAYRESHEKGPIYLFFSVNQSGHFCGMAQMVSLFDNTKSNLWTKDVWNGQFRVKWIFVKNIPVYLLRHIRLENNENKPVSKSRDTQEVLLPQGTAMLKIFATFKPGTVQKQASSEDEQSEASVEHNKSVQHYRRVTKYTKILKPKDREVTPTD